MSRAYENAQNRTAPRGTAEYRKDRQGRVIAYKAREIYEATFSIGERVDFENDYKLGRIPKINMTLCVQDRYLLERLDDAGYGHDGRL
jgi:hypothetical protein